VVGNGNTTYYTINAGSQWEVGLGTYSSTGPTLARTTVLSSSSGGSLVNFSTGTKDVFVTYPSGESVYQDGTAIAAGTSILGVANGGTGVASSTGTVSVVLSNSPTLVTPVLGAASATSITNGLGAVGTPSYTFTGDLNTGMWSPAADTIAFSEGGTEVMRINSSGNVGIGTSSPGSKLDVNGSSATDIFHVTSGTTYFTVGVTDGTQVQLNSFQSAVGAKLLSIQSAGGITNFGGNVGIGIASPGAVLQLNKASGAADLRFSVGGTLYGNMYASSSDMDIFAVTAIPLILGTNNTERMRIDSSGNVGIGQSSPGAKLDVTGNMRFSAASPNLEFNNGGPMVYSPAGNTLAFATGGGPSSPIERARIGSSGIVYVNTTSTPTFGTPKLIVDGGISGKSTVTINSSTPTTIAEGAGLLLLIRDNTNGGTAVVSYENAQTPVIISTSGGTTFQTGAPSGSAQIQLASKSGNLGVSALSSGDRNGDSLAVTILQTFT
jgi:hypothetical protein